MTCQIPSHVIHIPSGGNRSRVLSQGDLPLLGRPVVGAVVTIFQVKTTYRSKFCQESPWN